MEEELEQVRSSAAAGGTEPQAEEAGRHRKPLTMGLAHHSPLLRVQSIPSPVSTMHTYMYKCTYVPVHLPSIMDTKFSDVIGACNICSIQQMILLVFFFSFFFPSFPQGPWLGTVASISNPVTTAELPT